MSLEEAEAQLSFRFPERHRRALLDDHDPIHAATELLPLKKKFEEWTLLEMNGSLRRDPWKKWPAWLVAFATNGCGDYFAYDTRSEPYRIYYIGPEGTTAEEHITGCEREGFVFASFDEWYQRELKEAAQPNGPSNAG